MDAVATNLLGKFAAWYGDRGREGGAIVAVAVFQGGFILLVQTDEGLRQKTATSVRIEG
jgi:hypothetical protein